MGKEKSLMRIVLETTPDEIVENIKNKKCKLVGFGAGPACCAHYEHKFEKLVTIKKAFAHLEKYRHAIKIGRIEFENGSTLFFYCTGFKSWHLK